MHDAAARPGKENGGPGRNDGRLRLLETGSYTLEIAGAGTTGGDYSFRIVDLATALPLTPGVPVTTTLTSANRDEFRKFTATAGHRASLQFTGLPVNPGYFTLLGPAGETVATAGITAALPEIFLPGTGTYILQLGYPGDPASATYDFSLTLSNPASVSPAGFGTVHSGSLPSPDATVSLTFAGTAGLRVYFDGLHDQADAAQVQAKSPDGTVVSSGDSAGDYGPVVLPESGTYQLTVSNTGAGGSYRFRVLNLAAESTPLTFGSVIAGGPSPSRQTDVHRFEGTAGQSIYLDNLQADGAEVLISGPGNWVPVGLNTAHDGGPITLTEPGTYHLFVRGNQAADLVYRFRLLDPAQAPSTDLPLNADVAGTLNPGSSAQLYRFNGTRGQRLYYDALDGDFDPIPVRLLGAAGTVLFLGGNSDSDYGPFTVTEAGTYTVVIGGNSDALGDYRFRLIDTAQSPATSAPLDTTQSGILNAGTPDSPVLGARIYRFDATAGQQLFLDGLGGDGSAQWNLFDPTDLGQGGNAVNGDFVVTLTGTGRHLLVLNGGGVTAPVPYSVRVVPATISTQALVLGGNTSGTLTLAGQEVRYTFNGTVGQRVFYDALDAGPPGISVRLLGAAGEFMTDGFHMSDFGPFYIPGGGTSTLVIGGLSDAIGTFHFRLLDIASAPVLAFGTTTSGALTAPRGSQVYRVNGTAGQRLKFETVSSGTGGASWKFDGVAGQTLLNTSLTQDLGEVTLTVSGTYTLTVQPQEADGNLPGNLDFVIRASVLPDSPPAPSGFNVEQAGTLAAGGSQTFEFTAPAGTPLYFDSLEPAVGSLVMDLVLDGEKLGTATTRAPTSAPTTMATGPTCSPGPAPTAW